MTGSLARQHAEADQLEEPGVDRSRLAVDRGVPVAEVDLIHQGRMGLLRDADEVAGRHPERLMGNGPLVVTVQASMLRAKS